MGLFNPGGGRQPSTSLADYYFIPVSDGISGSVPTTTVTYTMTDDKRTGSLEYSITLNSYTLNFDPLDSMSAQIVVILGNK